MKILITGASRGIGLYLLKKFKEEGHTVFGTFFGTQPESDLAKYFTKVDVGNTKEVQQWVEKNVTENDEIVLVNCAGINYNSIARRADVDDWMNVININLGGTFRAIRSVLPFMYKKGFGRIINFSSIVAQKGVIGTSAYAASKSALWGMTKAIAAENAQKGITINNINLGYMNAGMTLNEVPENLREEIIKQNPSKKLGDLENVYKTVKYLMDTEYINGTSIDLNGGLL
ncbi:MAG TPA: SDR family NAD(P)-dependent oxidoreductase [Paludibacteraceae bacterium]|nr:SDR family NAD(P)-dependent oxidoreductase [Bacteroidales bacterium]HOO19275.1 SDR family NAD(P)-dependent oxidoreductase [Paludibacteraceae bacterium]HRR62552.1 SDR family NAD(P)-dependent oxidoreductase [Paludibacteraceae bacterium]